MKTRLIFTVAAAAVSLAACSDNVRQQDRLGSARQDVGTSKDVIPLPPAPPLPSAGGTYTDPAFGTAVMRVTDSGDGADCGVDYSYWPSFNANSTRLQIRCDNNGILYSFDPSAFRLTGKEPLFQGSTPNGTVGNPEDAIWSSSNPNVIFAHDLNNLWMYDVTSKSYSMAGNLQALIPGHHVFQMSKSDNDDVFAWTEKDASYSNIGYVVYSRSQNRLLYHGSTTQLDEVQVDKSGSTLVVKTGQEAAGQIRVVLVDLATGGTTNLTAGAPDFACGHSDNGHGFAIGADNFNNTIQFRAFADPHGYRSILSFGNDWTQANHISALSGDEGWVVVSTYAGNTDPGLFHGEIFQVATDGSEQVRRLAHHRSLYREYYDTPRANISRDGRFVAYTSNWGGGPRSVFVLRTDAGAPSPAPGPAPSGPSCGEAGGNYCAAAGDSTCNGHPTFASRDCATCCRISALPSCGAAGGNYCAAAGDSKCNGHPTFASSDCATCCRISALPSCGAAGGNYCAAAGDSRCNGHQTFGSSDCATCCRI